MKIWDGEPETCDYEEISSDRSDMPANIRAIKVDFFDAASLKRALDLCRPPVQIVLVESETPFSEEGKEAAREFAKMTGDFLIQGEQLAKSVDVVRGVVIDRGADIEQKKWRDFFDRIATMQSTIKGVKGAHLNNTTLFTDLVSWRSPDMRQSFHAHGKVGQNGFYLTAPLSDISTLFARPQDLLGDITSPNYKHAIFGVERPVFWQAKPWSFLVFTVGEHSQGNAVHCVPEITTRRLTVAHDFTVK